MRLLETGNDKVKKICEILKKETLDPAKHQAEELLDHARKEAEKIVAHAHEKASQMIRESEERLKKDESVFTASLNLACKQGIGKLKAEIQSKIFNTALIEKIQKELNQDETIAHCIRAIFDGVSKSGMEADAEIILAKNLSKEVVAKAIAKAGIDQQVIKVISTGEFSSGIQVKIAKENLTIDLSDETVAELITNFASENLKKMIFNL